MRRVQLRNEKVKVTARFRESGSVLRGDRRGRCEGFAIELSIDSDEPEPVVADLIRLAHRMCFTEFALATPIEITSNHLFNGRPIQVDESSG
jgi:hypothetical protein